MKKILLILLFLYLFRVYDITVAKGDDETDNENNIIIPIPTIELTSSLDDDHIDDENNITVPIPTIQLIPSPIPTDIINSPGDIIITPTPDITETPTVIPSITDTPTITEAPTTTLTPILTITPSETPLDTITPTPTMSMNDSSQEPSSTPANQNTIGSGELTTSTPILNPTETPTITPTPTSTPSFLSKPIITKISKITPPSFLTKNPIYQELYKSGTLPPQTTKLFLSISMIFMILGAALIWFNNLYKALKERLDSIDTKTIRKNFLKVTNER